MIYKLKIFLIFEALTLLIICVLGGVFNNLFTSLFSFPYEQIGDLLRLLSLGSQAGNIFAIFIYCILGSLPILYLIYRKLTKSIQSEDNLLILMSIMLFVIIYLMINPGYIGQHFGTSEIINGNKALISLATHSIFIGYLILRGLRVLRNSNTDASLKYLKLLLSVVLVVLVFSIFGTGINQLFSSYKELLAGNTMLDQDLTLSYLFLGIQYLVDVLPYLLQIIIIFYGLELIQLLTVNPYREEVSFSARKLGHTCHYSIVIILLSQISINVLQVLLGGLIRSSHYVLSIPLLSIVFVLVAMLFAGYIEQAKQFKDDNDMFI